MESLWPLSFDVEDEASPKEIVKFQIDKLEEITGGLVYAELIAEAQLSEFFSNTNYDFNYTMRIRSKYLATYSFAVFSLKHNIPFYPVDIVIEEETRKELGLPGMVEPKLKNEDELIEMLKKIFTSQRINKIIGTLIRMSKIEL
ncbi:hypothetical protein [Pelosinus baikalensis]|uniref:Uncharacterized protein n=1 Tax=Pelosinus baikalensis TaxID=2892015 RepID=A0ABS8HYV3_9FIRM|nr:hypothetical protein [Pelosinus baikalensis]MCC5468358.1 hypothetical protein [Pelosinus baikalensis]